MVLILVLPKDARKHLSQFFEHITTRQKIDLQTNFTNTPKFIRSTSFSEVIQQTFNLILPVLKIVVSPDTKSLVREGIKIEKLFVTRYQELYLPTIKCKGWIHRFPNDVYENDLLDPTYGFHFIGAVLSTDVKLIKKEIVKWVTKEVDGVKVNFNTYHRYAGQHGQHSKTPLQFLAELSMEKFYINDLCIKILCDVFGCKVNIHKCYDKGDIVLSIIEPRPLTKFEKNRIEEGLVIDVVKQRKDNVTSYALVHSSPYS